MQVTKEPQKQLYESCLFYRENCSFWTVTLSSQTARWELATAVKYTPISVCGVMWEKMLQTVGGWEYDLSKQYYWLGNHLSKNVPIVITAVAKLVKVSCFRGGGSNLVDLSVRGTQPGLGLSVQNDPYKEQ